MNKRFWATMVLWAGMLVLSACLGRYSLTLWDISAILLGNHPSEMAASVFWNIRFPRVVLTALGGGALAVSGMVFQTVFANPLVSPDVLGVTSGCSVGAVTALLFLPGWTIPLSAFGCGILTVGFALFLASFVRHNRVLGMVLAGIVVGSISSAILMLLKFLADPEKQLASIEYWLMGSFQNISGWNEVAVVTLLILPALLLLYGGRFRIKLLSLGDDQAQSLGIRPIRVRLLAVGCATVLVAAVVSAAGVVSWIGLLAPHILRFLGGKDITKSIGSCFFTGGILLMAADLCARCLSTVEIPVSIFTSLFGAVFLCGLFLRAARQKGRQI
ncbi:MAG: FecCD family ABC transporter permease [Candidatus Merdivicinus sp.]|jgi:iron complex transport system permease protein